MDKARGGRPATVLVLDIGKTNAKAVLVDAATLGEIDVLTAPNRPLPGPPYPHADVEGIWRFLLEAARALQGRHGVGAIAVTAHGATAALVDRAGGLALPVLDYEFAGPDELAAAYDAARPDFAETGSPRLPAGLTLGAQLFWQFRRFPAEAARAAAILMYPQYWSFRLTGVAASERTSLGCHTDLWDPHGGRFSSLVEGMGWSGLMPPLRRAADVLGPVTAEVAAATGLDPATPVHCGIHDSNASLLPHLMARKPPFAVVSTGTWVVSMAIGGRKVTLDAARDTLVNVNAFGDPVPSARFMGGREWSRLMEGREAAPTAADAEAVLAHGAMLFPAVEPGSGPFPGRAQRWSVPEAALAPGERAVVVAWYLALTTGVCLELIGAEGPVVVEGPLAANPAFTGMLAAIVPGGLAPASPATTGTSAGAALLALPPGDGPAGAAPEAARQPRAPRLAAYAARWRAEVDRAT
ncbi:FGGY-family carbohydrate kinase [Amaricoccus sp.]|uniref:FGGY-family carbohydrate kinase n=1 Tax=Amaricoccus sp. TaxID=1872485 RepID=UPI0026233E42|nr:FGGY-family carbohydrate kinase [Amaricoccus sp.]HRO11172.1 FGGY-family carbohydrate kinase [Amaricoccus sp.]